MVLLDLDGTLTNPATGIVRCIRHALSAMGADTWLDADLTQCIGPPLQESFRHLLGTDSPHAIAEAMEHYRGRFAEVGLFENEVYPGVPEALEQLAMSGYHLRVATSKPHVFAERILEHFGLRDFFADVYGSELSGVRTNKGELISYLLAREQVETHAVCMVGDRKHDIHGARSNGLTSVGVLWGFGTRLELEEAGADVVAEAVPDLVSTLRTLGQATGGAADRGAP